MKSTERKEWIDIIKGMGILCVMLFHSCGVPYIGRYIIGFYVQMFFFIAGYTSNMNKDGFMQKRAKRLLIPYFVYSALIVTLSLVLFGCDNQGELIKAYGGILYSRYSVFHLNTENNIFLLAHNNAPLWFLTALFCSSAITFVFHKMRISPIVSIVICIMISLVLRYVPVLLPWSLDMAFMGAAMILTGQIWRELDEKTKINTFFEKTFIILFVIYVLLARVNGTVNMSVGVYGQKRIFSVAFFMAAGAIGTLLLSIVIRKCEGWKGFGIFKFLGKNTVTILCTHAFVYQCVETLVNNNISNIYILAGIKIALSIGIAMCLSYIFKKVKKKCFLFEYL